MEGLPKQESSISEKDYSIEEAFKDSKVRSDDGLLLTVYHYSDEEIEKFSSEFVGKNYQGDKGFFGSGIYFTDSEKDFNYGKNLYPAYLNLKNPLIIKNPTLEDVQNLHGQKSKLEEQGYDGVMVWNDETQDETRVVFGKEQLVPGRKAGWSEICVFKPDNIYMIKPEIN